MIDAEAIRRSLILAAYATAGFVVGVLLTLAAMHSTGRTHR